MAVETPSISRLVAPRASLDYQGLYLEGLKHIEALAGKIWTDYNAHDPGITTLEMLCYAITELGYRTDFEIGDIIEPDPDSSAVNDFFSLGQLASNAPLTITDFRKVLIDLDGIRNAWLEKLEKTTEGDFSPKPDLYWLLSTGDTMPHLQNHDAAGAREIDIRGLYNVYLQFEEHPDFGDLNDNSLSTSFWIKPIGQTAEREFEVEIEFPVWEQLSDEFDAVYQDVLAAVPATTVFELRLKDNLIAPITGQQWVFQCILEVNPNGRLIELPLAIRIVTGQEYVLNYTEFIARLRDEFWNLDIGPTALPFYDGDDYFNQQEIVQVMLTFLRKRALIQKYLEGARAALAEHRNLCEDFQQVYPMSLQEIGIDVEIVVTPGTDCDEVMARIYHATERYLSPPIRFYSLREMLDKGYKPEEIFEGPWLCNGFIDQAEASFNERRDMLYTSDLLREFMKIEGVESVNKILLSRYQQGKREEYGLSECMCLKSPERFLPSLNYAFSHVGLDCGNGRFEEHDRSKALELLAEYKALDRLKGSTGKGDYAIPQGDHYALEDYHSIQHEYPVNYAIGSEGLSPDEPVARFAQANQFKAYLLFFEQLLANYLSQLSHVRQLYSYQDEDRTYFTQVLFQVPRVKELIADAQPVDDLDYPDYVNLPSSDPLHIRNRVNLLAEDEATFHDRRYRFLDHLLARFNESFSEYAAYVFSRAVPKAEQYSRLIQDQARFLRNYAIDSLACVPGATDRRRGHSNNRGTAFDYTLPLSTSYVPDSYFDPGVGALLVEGLKKRMVYLTGLPKVERTYVNPFERSVITESSPGQWTFVLNDATGSFPVLSTLAGVFFADEDAARAALLQVIVTGQAATQYVENAPDLHLMLDIDDPLSMIALVDAAYRSGFGSDSDCANALAAYLTALYSIENFHIVEHILLRQRSTGDPFLPLRYFADCAELNIDDPYSFRISVVLPNWAGRFGEMDFRRMFKRIMRMEAPAHVYIHFYWVDPVQMYCFEHCWNDWLNGEWIDRDLRLLWEDDNVPDQGPMLQENFYNILVERQENMGDDETFFVTCMAKLRNLEDAYYTLSPQRIVDQWENCDVLAYVVDPDSEIVRATVVEGSLPPGVCLEPCTGALRVSNAAALAAINVFEWPIVILTTSASGEQTYHNVNLAFTPNGPAYVSFRSTTLHIDAFVTGEVLRQFLDPDGIIVMATVLGWSLSSPATGFPGPITGSSGPIPGFPLPPGMAFDQVSGEITVSDADALYPGTYMVSMRLLDANGGETVVNDPIVIQPDAEAVGVALTPTTQNQDLYAVGDVVATVADADGDLVAFALRAGENPLASLGLDLRMVGSPVTGEVYIASISAFQAALTSLFNLSGGIYRYTLRLETEDAMGGQSDVDIVLTVRRDNSPVFAAVPLISVDQFHLNRLAGTITESLDNGLASFSTVADLNLMGLAISLDFVGVAHIRVADPSNFAAFMGGLTPDINNVVTSTFLVSTVDRTGGNGAVNCIIRARLDQEPMIDYTPVLNVDRYLKKQVLARIWDPDGNGIVTATQVGGTLLSSMGLTMIVGAQTGYPTPVARIEISNLAQFVNAVSFGMMFAPAPPSGGTVRCTVQVDTTDTLGGVGHLDVDIDVIRDIEATVLTVLNGQRVDTYSNNDVLFRFQDPDPGAVFVSHGFDTPLPAGLGMRLVMGQYEIYVSNTAALVAGEYPRTVTLTDDLGGVTELAIVISILKRVVNVSFVVEAMNVSHILDLSTKVPGLEMVTPLAPLFPKSFGTLYVGNGIQLGFSEGTGFASSMFSYVVTFDGTMGAEAVEGRLGVSRKLKTVKSPAGSGTSVSGSFANNAILNSSNVLGNARMLQSTNATGRLMYDLGNVSNFPENPLLRTNPGLVGAYANGAKDAEVATALGNLVAESGAEILRLQGLIPKSNAKTGPALRAELGVWAELFRQQVVLAMEFAGMVRRDDTSAEVDQLFDQIAALNRNIR